MWWVLLVACTGGADTGEAAAEPPWTQADEVGPYGVGVETVEFTDARGKPLTLEIWYPAQVDPDTPPATYGPTTLSLAARREAPADLRGAPYPLLGFSHGYGGVRYQSVSLTEHLASHGFVVVAPDHTHNTMFDLDESLTPQVLVERPDDIRYAVDQVYTLSEGGDPLLGGMVRESDGYGIVGHSFGAWTAMVLGGGVLDYDALATFCQTSNSYPCQLFVEVDPALADGHGTVDDRVIATVPLAPGVWYSFGPDGVGLQQVVTPFVMGGDRDQVLHYSTEIVPSYEAMSAPKRLGTIADAGHYVFSDICSLAPFFTNECEEEEGGWVNLDDAHAVINAQVAAFVGVNVAGDDRYQPVLDEDFGPLLTVEQE